MTWNGPSGIAGFGFTSSTLCRCRMRRAALSAGMRPCLICWKKLGVGVLDGGGVLDRPRRDRSHAGGDLAGALASRWQRCHIDAPAQVRQPPIATSLLRPFDLLELERERGPL